MAGVPPFVIAGLWGNPGLIAFNEITAGYHWHLGLVAPSTQFRPPLHPVSFLYRAAPAVLPPATIVGGPCDDRALCDPGGPTPGVANACSHDIHNPAPAAVGGPAGGPTSKWVCTGGIRPAGFENHPPGVVYETCYFCIRHALQQDWAREMLDDINRVPRAPTAPGPGPAQNLLTYRTFKTYLCTDCEDFEQYILHQRQLGNHYGMPVATRQMCRNYPLNNCICTAILRSTSLCIRDRHDHACLIHDYSLMRRQQNDFWLRTVRRRPDGSLEPAPWSLITDRDQRGVFRGCRCGAEIKPRTVRPRRRTTPRTYVPPSVYLCMGCEGVVHVAQPAGPPRRRTRQYARLEAQLAANQVVHKLRKW